MESHSLSSPAMLRHSSASSSRPHRVPAGLEHSLSLVGTRCTTTTILSSSPPSSYGKPLLYSHSRQRAHARLSTTSLIAAFSSASDGTQPVRATAGAAAAVGDAGGGSFGGVAAGGGAIGGAVSASGAFGGTATGRTVVGAAIDALIGADVGAAVGTAMPAKCAGSP